MAVWFITGVGRGLGRALAQAVLARGDRVAGSVRRPEDAAPFEALAPGSARGFVLDVASEADVHRVVAEAEAALGPLDVAVNNAGYGLVGAVEEVSLDEVRRQFEVNVLGPLAVVQAVLPGMRARRRGTIVNVTSVSGLAAWAGTGAYCASKFALEAVGRTLAQEVATLGIRVMNVAPGGMRTDYAGASMQRAARRIDDYEGPGHDAELILTQGAGRESGDPRRVAAAILTALKADAPPLHLILGEDALHYAERQALSLATDLQRFLPLTLDVAFEASPAP